MFMVSWKQSDAINYFPLISNANDNIGGNDGTLKSASTGVGHPAVISGGVITFPGNYKTVNQQTGTDIIPFGKTTGYQKVAQSFVLDDDSNGVIQLIGFKRAPTTGSISVNEYMEIWSDSGGSPNAKVGSLTWTWSSATWAQWSTTIDTYNRTNLVTGLTPGTTYWLVFYKASNDDNSYPNLYYNSVNNYGVLKRFDGSNWQTVTGSLRFSLGYTDYIDLDSQISLTYNSFSIAWGMKTTSNAYECLFSKVTISSSGQIEVNANANCIRFESNTNGAYERASMTTGITISDGNWHHYVITSGVSYFRLYVDGTKTYETTPNTDTANQLFEFIGAMQTAPNGTYGVGFSGSMRDIRFFDKELNQTEVTALQTDLCQEVSINSTSGEFVVGSSGIKTQFTGAGNGYLEKVL